MDGEEIEEMKRKIMFFFSCYYEIRWNYKSELENLNQIMSGEWMSISQTVYLKVATIKENTYQESVCLDFAKSFWISWLTTGIQLLGQTKLKLSY